MFSQGAIAERLADGLPPDLAVVDCDLANAADLYGDLHGVIPVPTVLIFRVEPPGFATKGSSHADRDEYALKPLSPDALVYRLQALLIRCDRALPTEAGQDDEGTGSETMRVGTGHVVSVFAPKGGVGKTTIAVNLAVALREQTRARICLLDADIGVGNVSSVLALKYHMGLADLADSSPSEWTNAAFEQIVTIHEPSGVEVITWGNDPAQSVRVTVDLLLAAVRWAKANYSWVVIDNHPSYDDRTMAMLAIANEIFLVVTPEVGPIRNAAQFLEVARQVGLAGAVRVIVNRSNHGVSLHDIAASLRQPVSATIVSNGPFAVAAANEGMPIVTKFPGIRMSADLHGVARLLTQGITAAAAPSGRPWWATLAGRLSGA